MLRTIAKIYGIYFLFLTLLLAQMYCKENKEAGSQKQALGIRYSRVDLKVLDAIGGKVAFTLSAHSSVLVLEEISRNKKIFYKIQNEQGITGFQEKIYFTDHLLYAIEDGVALYSRPSLVSESYGLMQKGAYCFVLETEGTWAKADCRSVQFFPKLLDLNSVYISTDSPGLSRDTYYTGYVQSLRKIQKLLSQSAEKSDPKSLAKARQAILQLQSQSSPLQSKLIELLTEYNRLDPMSPLSP